MDSPLLPKATRRRVPVLEWTMWQMGGDGPMFGQAHYFRRMVGEQGPYGVKRYTDETHRLYGVADRPLADNEFTRGGASGRERRCQKVKVWGGAGGLKKKQKK